MSADEQLEQAQTHLLRHALAMDGWLDASYCANSYERYGDAMAAMLVSDPPLFTHVEDPNNALHERFHLTATGLIVAAMFEGVDA